MLKPLTSFVFLIMLLLVLSCNQSKESKNSETESLADEIQNRELLSELIRNRIESAGVPPQISVASELILASQVLPNFYENRIYHPAWVEHNRILPQATALIELIRTADQDGLHPDDYHLEKILAASGRNQQQKPASAEALVDLELLLTDAFLLYGSHLLNGKVNPRTIDPEWFVSGREGNLAEVLQTGVATNQIEAALASLRPVHQGYGRLKQALTYYRRIAAAGGWSVVPDGPKLKMNDEDPRIIPLRQRLIYAGDLDPAQSDSSIQFDAPVDAALRKFQKRHGLFVDGVLGATTLANLNVPVEKRIRTVELNLERWRWLPQDLAPRHILVNIANFELDVVEANQIVLSMRVMVGKDYRRTPVFSDLMTYLVFCPYWHVPPTIARNDMMPAIRKDSNYLARQKIRVFQGWGAQAKEIDPTTVDWAQITAQNLPFHFRQDPGPQNALGRVKFMFPNQFDVYLHDTPAQGLFERAERAFSSGCIRIEKPIALAIYLLQGNSVWTETRVKEVIDRGIEQTVRLPEPIAIYLLYWTAWANDDGSISFRRDIYNRDEPLAAALKKEPPRPN